MALPPNWDNVGGDEEWEICNDGGFVYKRRRRRRLPSDADGPLRSPPPSPPRNRDAESRRDRRRKTLLSLRDRYGEELQQWEQLSSTLALITEPPPPPPPNSPPPPAASTAATAPSAGVEELLLLQVEAQESAIEKARELCDYADAVCDAEEERAGEVLVDLPVWGSPRCLVAALMSSSL